MPVIQAPAESPMMSFMSQAFLMMAQQMSIMARSGPMTHPADSSTDGSTANSESVGELNANSFAQPMIFSSVFMQFSLQIFGRAMPMSTGEQPPGPAPVSEEPVLVTETSLPTAEQPGAFAESPVLAEAPTVLAPPAVDVDDSASPAGSVPASVPADESGSDDRSHRSRFPIAEVNAQDFRRYRLRQLSTEFETSLTLELKTQDGDVITLDFSQLDVVESTKFRGRTHDGDRYRVNDYYESTRRVVNMEVRGDLSEAEKEAINKVLSAVIEAADKFFDGSIDKAMKHLKAMEFDAQELAEFPIR